MRNSDVEETVLRYRAGELAFTAENHVAFDMLCRDLELDEGGIVLVRRLWDELVIAKDKLTKVQQAAELHGSDLAFEVLEILDK